MMYIIAIVLIVIILASYIDGKRKPKYTFDDKPDQPDESDEYVRLDFNIYDDGETITPNVWYQRERWKNKRLIAYSGTYDRDWKKAGEVRVAGNTFGNRREMFLRLVNTDGFKFTLEPEPDNPVNPNSIKVMAWGTLNGQLTSKHIGYLPDDIANQFAGVELDVRPKAVLLPGPGFPHLSIELILLVRSAVYLKRMTRAK